MGGGGGQSTQSSGSSHETKVISLPPWVEAASQKNYGLAEQIADQPYQSYDYNLWPEFSDNTKLGINRAVGEADRYRKQFEDPINWMQAMQTWGNVQQGDLNEYMNPYTENVVNRTMTGMETEAAKGRRKINQEAQAAKAFGGSRMEVEQGVYGGETLAAMGDTEAKLRERAYDKAREYQQADWGRQFKNRDDLRTTAKMTSDLASAAQQGQSQDYFNILSAGKMQEDQMRERLEEDYKKWSQRQQHPLEMLNVRLAALGMSPYGRTETTDKTESSTSKSKSGGSDIGGGILGGLGIIKGLAPLLMGSDRDLKTNIEKLGTDPDTDLPVYAYDYKADVKGKKVMPGKRVGYMAQDVEKKYPSAVKKINGKRVIDMTQLAAVA
jgi:hypothetical protein